MVYQNFQLIHFKITIFFPKQFDTVESSGNTSDELLKACRTKRGQVALISRALKTLNQAEIDLAVRVFHCLINTM